MGKLQTLSGPLGTPAYELTGKFITIGRAHGNTIHLNHRSVSKYHALLVVDDDQVQLFDLHSTNGTFLNGQYTATCPLKPNDEILMGEFLFRYERADVAVPVPVPLPVVAPAPQPVQQTITAEIAKKLAVPAERNTTGSIKPTPAADRSFIRLPGETPAEEKPSLVQKLLKRETGGVPPKPVAVPAPQPVSPVPPPAPPTPAPEQILPKPVATGEKTDAPLLKKPGAPGGGERLLIKRGGPAADRVIKKPTAPPS